MTVLLHPLVWAVLVLMAGPLSPLPDEATTPAMPDFSHIPLATVLGVDEVCQVTVLQASGTNLQIRLAWVQVPPEEPARPTVQAFLRNLLAGEKVWLVQAAPGPNARDDKWYVYRWPDKLFVNLEVVRQAYADMAVEPNGSAVTARAIKYWRDQARQRNRGIWAVAAATRPAASQPAVCARPSEPARADAAAAERYRVRHQHGHEVSPCQLPNAPQGRPSHASGRGPQEIRALQGVQPAAVA